MLRSRFLAAVAAVTFFGLPTLAQEAGQPPAQVDAAPAPALPADPARLPAPEAAADAYCTPPTDLGLPEADVSQWSACEKWVWHCVRSGLEANLFEKKCLHPRGGVATAARERHKFAPFVEPDAYKDTNRLSPDFLITLLTAPALVTQIKPIGIRIVGAYFAGGINLENVATSVNFVLDQTMARSGLRMTNFESKRNVSLDGSNIKGVIRLMRARIDGSLFMEKAALDVVDLNDAHVGASFEATGSIFKGELRFNRARIDGKVILTQSRLTTLMAWGAHIGSSLEMRLADIRVGMDMTGSTVEGDVRLQDVTFGRLTAPNRCDWNPRLQQQTQAKGLRAADLLTSLATQLAPEDFEQAWREAAIQREFDGTGDESTCAPSEDALQPGIKQNVLLRDMQIKGSLCIMNVTGEIERAASLSDPQHIKTISIDGSEAKTTILGWKDSTTPTRWAAVNYKTQHLLVNLNTQPAVHWVDNLTLRVITFMRQPGQNAQDGNAIVGEHIVKHGCDITPDEATTERPDQADVQQRVITFFQNDRSESAQPFAAIVASLQSSGINTARLSKELSLMQARNACTSSEFAKSYRLAWSTIHSAWESALQKRKAGQSAAGFLYEQTPLMVSDAGCAAWHQIQYHTVRHGHEPLRLLFWIAAAVLLFTALLRIEYRKDASFIQRKRPGIVYAIDTLIPVRAYRIDPLHADELPRTAFVRGYRLIHRLLGLFFVVMAFLYIYKAT